MEQTFTINGMTCNGCRTSVEKKLNELEAVQTATVSLEDETATIESAAGVGLDVLRTALPEKYSITPKDNGKAAHPESAQKGNVFKSNHDDQAILAKTSKLAQLKPLFLILGYIVAAVVLLNYQDWDTSQAMLDFMGLFYIVFSFFKMLDLKGFASSFQMYDPLAKRFPAYGMVYPFIETALGLLFLLRFQMEIALIATLVVLGITTIGVTKTLLDKKAIQCACLGTALKLPMTEATFIENAIMIVMAITMLTNLI